MLQAVHVEMMHAALDGLVGARALRLMINANVGVDAIWNQIGRHELHFDDNAFEPSYRYLQEQANLIPPALERGKPDEAWSAFGRLCHTAQDFYSHTNYIDLWIGRQAPGRIPPPASIDPLDEAILTSPELCSGRINLPLELLAYLPVVGSWIEQIAPHDSHASMHLDSAARGPKFEYAFQAAVKRTRWEYDQRVRTLPAALRAQFCDLPAGMGAPLTRE